MKEISLLEKSILNTKFFDSKIKTCSVSWKEKYLGHLIGPLGLILVVNTVAALVEKFFTQQVGAMYGEGNAAMISAMGKKYEMVMTVAKILAVATGLLVSWLISHTKSKQGRLRPWYLIFGFCSVAIAATIFLFSGNTLGDNYWYYFFTLLICYHTIGTSYFYLFRDNIVSLYSISFNSQRQRESSADFYTQNVVDSHFRHTHRNACLFGHYPVMAPV